MRKFILLYVVLLSTAFVFISRQPVHAITAIVIGAAPEPLQVAPLPPPTSTTDADETIVARLDEPFTLPLRQWVTIRDTAEQFSVQLTSVVSDSRCPATVNCVVAGQAEFKLLLRTGNVVSPRHFTIGSYPIQDQNKVRYAGYEIELTDVQPPAPPPDQTLQPSDYQVTFIVRHDGAATPEPTATPTATPAPQDDIETGQPAVLNRPFTLRAGETADLRDVDFQVTLRSVTDDSGCLTASDCSVMLAEGTLVLQQREQREVLTFNVSFTPEQSFDYDFAGYVVQLIYLKKGRDGEHLATFVVKKPTATVEIPAPQRVARCPAFSRFDAAAILQEEVAKEAVANLVFGPLAPDADIVAGMCGYVTTAFSDARVINEQAPALLSEVAADRAVAATEIDGSDITRLLQLANLVAAAEPEAHTDTLLRLQAQLTAGAIEGYISDLTAMAEAFPTFTVSPIQGIGDEGVWLWQPVADGYFALLIMRYDQHFQVVTALLNEDAEEVTVLDYAVLLVRRQDQHGTN